MRIIGLAALAALTLGATAFAQDPTLPPTRTAPCPTISKVEAGPFTMIATRVTKVSDCLTRARYAGKATLSVTPCVGDAYRVQADVVIEAAATVSACGDGVIEGNVIVLAPTARQSSNGPLNGVVGPRALTAVWTAEVVTKSTTKAVAPPMHLKALVTGVPGTTADGKATLEVTIKGVLVQPSAAKR